MAVIYARSANGSDSHSAPGEAQMTRCLRLIVSTLQQAIPPPGTRSKLTPAGLDGFVGLLETVILGLLALADLHPPNMREDLCAVAYTFYARLLKDETTEVDAITPTLPIFKTIIERSIAARAPGSDLITRIVHGMLSACLTNVDEVRCVTSSPCLLTHEGREADR